MREKSGLGVRSSKKTKKQKNNNQRRRFQERKKEKTRWDLFLCRGYLRYVELFSGASGLVTGLQERGEKSEPRPTVSGASPWCDVAAAAHSAAASSRGGRGGGGGDSDGDEGGGEWWGEKAAHLFARCHSLGWYPIKTRESLQIKQHT